MVFVLCRNRFSVAKRSKLMCLFNYLTCDTILRNVSSPQRAPGAQRKYSTNKWF
jgi:hypothetical protein